MERRLTEEQITKFILDWLENKGWEIICFDFPQSGTGIALHSSSRTNKSKNKDDIIPDIVAIKGTQVVFFENKAKFVLADFKKIKKLKTSKDYLDSISKLLNRFVYEDIYYGVGLPINKPTNKKAYENKGLVDFIVQTDTVNTLVTYQIINIF